MAADLKDFRGKITPETWCVIEAEHRATGEDHSAIVRDVLHGWATKKIRAANLTAKLLAAEGITGEGQG
ncbi:hypothetical protein [Lysobacter olei]